MSTTKTKKKILVLGGTGKTGSRVAQKLKQLGWPVRNGSRAAEVPFDWENQCTWRAVLQGMDSVYVTFQPDLAMPAALPAIELFSSMAFREGIKKIVLLSGRGEAEAQACEQVIMKTGTDWTIVRASWFFQNFSESHMLEPILAGYVSLPVGNVGEPFIDADDIADVVVAALTEDGHDGKLYEVTGPRLITFKEAIDEIATATGRVIEYSQVSATEYESMLDLHGVPKEITSLLSYLFSEVLDGRNAVVTNGVETALGRRARDFSDYIRRTASTGIWNQTNQVSQ
jgi:uncharacterized protein YbjT (DUF2867 family)